MARAKTSRNQAMFLVHGPWLSCKKEQTNEDGKIKAFEYMKKSWYKSDKTASWYRPDLIIELEQKDTKTHQKISRKDKYLQQRR